MYTECPECGTIFRVTAEQLQVARGDVRCGDCANTFNALETLTDAPPADPDGDADELEALLLDDPLIPEHEQSLEFDVPEQNWATFFIDAEPRPGQAPSGDSSAGGEDPRFLSDDDCADDAHLFMQAEDTADHPPWVREQSSDPARRALTPIDHRWWLPIIALGLTLLIQFVHYNRDTLAASARFGDLVNRAYGSVGATLYPNWSLDAYEVLGSEVIGAESNALRILANIEVTGNQAVGLPLIRVLLRDRWSDPIAGEIFRPDEYLRGDAAPPTPLSAGENIAVKLTVVDPGPDAQGYELDVCLPRRNRGLVCQSDRSPFNP